MSDASEGRTRKRRVVIVMRMDTTPDTSEGDLHDILWFTLAGPDVEMDLTADDVDPSSMSVKSISIITDDNV